MARIASVETFIVTIPRDTPYLGPLGPGERINARGYVVRRGNGTIYPTVDRSIVVRVTTDSGLVGWGETYGICAPRATCEIVNDLLAPVLEADGGMARLELAANFGCESEGQLRQFENLGFRSFVGHQGISVGAVAMQDFLRNWLSRCKRLDRSVHDTNRTLDHFFATSPFAKLIFTLLSNENEYTAVMKSFGDNLEACD